MPRHVYLQRLVTAESRSRCSATHLVRAIRTLLLALVTTLACTLGLQPAVSQAAEPLHASIMRTGAGGVLLQVDGDADPGDAGVAGDESVESVAQSEPPAPEPSSANSEQPAPEPTLVAAPPPAPAPIRPKVGVGKYTVVQGDTMFSIARRADLSLQVLAAANGIADPNAVKAGQVLYLPAVPGSVHAVAKDDTFERILERYGAESAPVREANGLAKDPKLTAGQLLVIPGVMRATLAEIRPLPSTMSASVLPAANPSATPPPTTPSKSAQPAPSPAPSGPRSPVSAEVGTMIWPVVGQISTTYTATHRGLDVVAKQGTPVKAALAGKVIAAQEWEGPYGWYVIVQHGADFTTVYAHLSKIRVKEGDTVRQGEVVGDVGSTGKSTGPHLHLELRKSNLPIDPRPYLP